MFTASFNGFTATASKKGIAILQVRKAAYLAGSRKWWPKARKVAYDVNFTNSWEQAKASGLISVTSH